MNEKLGLRTKKNERKKKEKTENWMRKCSLRKKKEKERGNEKFKLRTKGMET